MALEDILRSMEEQAKETHKQIIAEAKSEADKILAEARRHAEEIYERETERILAPLKSEKTRIVNEARLEMQQQIQKRKQELWREAFEGAKTKLAELRLDARYPEIFASLLDEALEGMDHKVVVEVAPVDQELAERTVAERFPNRSATVRPNEGIIGGVNVSSPHSGVRSINTLDARLERVAATKVSELASELFAGEAAASSAQAAAASSPHTTPGDEAPSPERGE